MANQGRNRNIILTNDNRLLNITLGIVLIILMVWLLIIGRTIILPFMIAVFLALVLDPVVNLMTGWKIPQSIAVFLTLAISFLILYLLGMLVYANVQLFVNQFPEYESRLYHIISQFTQQFEAFFGKPLNIQLWKQIDWLDTLQRFSIARTVLSSVGTFVTFILKTIIVIIFIAYLLNGMRTLSTKIEAAFPPNQARQIISIIDKVTRQVQKYLGAKTLVSLVTGIISIAIFYAFGLDFAVFWGFLIFLFNFIPTIGSAFASLLPVVFSFLQFGSFSTAFWILFSLTLLQQAMGNIVEPRLMGRTLNLSPLMVILFLIFWGYIWGVVGLILAVPILGTLTIIFENFDSLKFISVFFRGSQSK